VRVVQLGNVFPLGSCINCEVIKLPAFVNFFTTHFSWAVFENEPKWYWTQAQRGQLNYTDADRLLYFCDRAGKPVRGHCIFWAVEGEVQRWIKDIPATDRGQLTATVKARVRGLLGRYAGRFPHYDVNNEMLHGRFFRDRLGDAVAPRGSIPAPRSSSTTTTSSAATTRAPRRRSSWSRSGSSSAAARGWAASGCRVTSAAPSGRSSATRSTSSPPPRPTGLPVWITELDVR
jgi:hypothetical protein